MKIGIGTAQFGLDYGVSNRQGKTSVNEAKKIISLAAKKEITIIDTASSYGSSEETLGKILPKKNIFKIVTKTPTFSESITQKDVAFLEQSFHESLLKLKQSCVYGLMIHNADDLLKNNSQLLWQSMQKLKKDGLVQKIGVSAYTKNQIDLIINTFEIDIIQIPINVLDQRLLKSNLIKKLKLNGIEIHARSVFLQGLLLMPTDQLPDYFYKYKLILKKYFDTIEQNNLSKIQGALSFINNIDEIDHIIIGVCSSKQLYEIDKNIQSLPFQISLDFEKFSCNNEKILNPFLWQLNSKTK
jgi:aryl-alcohol dehydrogenase-like predicted oxidoreductase